MDVEGVLKEYAAADAIAEEIISERHEIADLDGKRNSGREALRHLKKLQLNPKIKQTQSWVCFGNTFIKMDSSSCIEMLEKDHAELTSEIERLTQHLKPKVAALHQLEGKAEAKGYNLKGMRVAEVLDVGTKAN